MSPGTVGQESADAVFVVATVVVGSENVEELAAAFERSLPAFHQEDGCLRYAVLRGEDRIVTVERWASLEAMQAHGEAEAGKELVATATRLATKPFDVQILRATAGGDPSKNSL